MIRRKKILAGLVAPLVVLGLAACSDDAEPSDAGNTAAPEETGGETEGGGGAEAALAELEGETMTFIVPFGAGGGFDVLARGMAPYLEEELGMAVVVENMEGAGGLLALNTVYTAEPDGTTITFPTGPGLAAAVLAESEGVQFDVEEFGYLARVQAEPRILFTNPEFATLEDVLAAGDGFAIATSGPGATDDLDARVLNEVLEGSMRLVPGFAGGAEAELAVVAGEVGGVTGTYGSKIGLIEAGDMAAVLTIGEAPPAENQDIPLLLDQEMSDEHREIAEAHVASMELGRLLVAPPGMDPALLEGLQGAFEAVLTNPDYVADMAEADQQINFMSGPELFDVMTNVLQAPQSYVDLLS